MHNVQKVETKRAFYGACGQILVLLREDIADLDEDKAIHTLEDMFSQVNSFWIKEASFKN
jgi:hypothetical protein